MSNLEVICRCGVKFDIAKAPWCKCGTVRTKMCPNGHCICHKLPEHDQWRPATEKEQKLGFAFMLKEKHGGVKIPRDLKDTQVELGRSKCDINLLPLDWFIKRPVMVKAMQADGVFRCNTPNGIVEGNKGDYIVIDVEGKAYPCKKSVFEKTHMKHKAKYDPESHAGRYP